LDNAYEEPSPDLMMLHWPLFDSVLDHPRFQDLLGRVGLPDPPASRSH
jgi:hypothetical protein